METRDHECRWGKMWGVLALCVIRGFRFSSALCVSCIRLPYGRMAVINHRLVGIWYPN